MLVWTGKWSENEKKFIEHKLQWKVTILLNSKEEKSSFCSSIHI